MMSVISKDMHTHTHTHKVGKRVLQRVESVNFFLTVFFSGRVGFLKSALKSIGTHHF